MAIIDATIVNVALPTIAGNLGATVDEVSWVATGYILASVCVMPLNGWLTAYFGRKNFYAVSLAIFTLSSLLCGTATSIWQLVFYRVLQGIGGGALQPTAQSILFESFPKEKRGQAMAIFGLGAMVGPAVGPTLGGYLVDNATWPLIFYINIPIGIAAFIMTLMFIPNPHYLEKPKGGVDWTGLTLLVAGLSSLQYVLERGEHDGWWDSSTIVLLTGVAVISLTFFIWKMIREREPLVNLKMFHIRTFAVGNIVGFISGFGLFGVTLILPLFLQVMLNLTAFDTGLVLLPGALATALTMFVLGRFGHKFDPRVLVAAGMLIFAYSAWWLGGLTSESGFWDVFWPRMIQGFGLGALFVPLTTASLGEVPIAGMAGATGVFTLVRQLGGSFGIAILTTLLTHEGAIAQNVLAGGVTQTHGVPLGVLSGMVVQQATMISYDYVFRLVGIVFVIATPLVFFMRAPRANPALAEAVAIAE